MTLRSLLHDGADIAVIASHLDGLTHEGRVAEVHGLSRGDQVTLYDRAASAPPLTLADFVPPTTGPRVEVVHEGLNNQPAFRLFEKRFCRPSDRNDRLFGFNEEALRALIGPGYFVAIETEPGNDRGGVVVDYYQVPDGPVVAGWPEVKPNTSGLQRFVFANTRDYMRRVSSSVTVGKAFKRDEKPIGYFVLCRR